MIKTLYTGLQDVEARVDAQTGHYLVHEPSWKRALFSEFVALPWEQFLFGIVGKVQVPTTQKCTFPVRKLARYHGNAPYVTLVLETRLSTRKFTGETNAHNKWNFSKYKRARLFIFGAHLDVCDYFHLTPFWKNRVIY